MKDTETFTPQWLIDQMEALKKLPPPTIERMKAQWEASQDYEDRLTFENMYRNDDYIR